ncbi:MAG: SDR family oxidoreductase [Bacteroidota bacterium]
MSLKGKKVVITGAAGAMGSALVHRFASEGMAVVGVIRQSIEKNTGSPSVTYLQADVSVEEDVRRVFAEAEKILGGFDILVNAVGGYIPGKPISDVSVDDWDANFRLNLQPVFLCTREALRYMKERSYGRIISFSAMTAFQPTAGRAPYSIAKAGVSLLTEIVARELKGTGITVNSIAPGIIATEENKSSMPNGDFSKWVTREEIVDTVYMLCREEAGSINGTTLKLYGGL